MKATIHIECEHAVELYQHLQVIEKQIRAQLAQPHTTRIKGEDSNCYGEHTYHIVKIEND